MRTIRQIYICKPGTILTPRPGKTNLQLREMQAMQKLVVTAMNNKMPVQLVTISHLQSLELEDIEQSAIICFNSAACFDNELAQLFRICSVLQEVDLTLISNDCRLNFCIYDEYGAVVDKLRNAIKVKRCHVRILTNAKYKLKDYVHCILDWPEAASIPVYHANLYTLPTFMPGAKSTDKTVDSVFACMHFKDYSTDRKSMLIAIKEAFGDNLVLTGDMSGMIVNGKQVESIVTDTKDVWQWYCNAKTTPVLLEPSYDAFGVMPNRVSEALACNCLPVLCTKHIDNYTDNGPIGLVLSVDDGTQQIINHLRCYADNWHTDAVQKRIANAKASMNLDIEAFKYQINNIFTT